MDGCELADSFVFNPHKWMLTNFDCSAYFVKDPGMLIRTFEIHPEYLKTDADKQVKNYRDWGIQLGRRFRALKLWFVIRSYGLEGMREIIRNHLEMMKKFVSWIQEAPDFEILAPVSLNLVCFRYNTRSKNLTEEELNIINKNLMDKLNSSGDLFLTHTRLKGKFTLRLCAGKLNTTLRHLEIAWKKIQSIAEAML
jgi:aromatic-L-amino-acid decarboxylase